jgi:hypothetical protein
MELDGQATDQEGWLARAMSVAGELWPWWVGLFDFHAWREIGAYLVPALVLLAVLMFWGIRRMHLGN